MQCKCSSISDYDKYCLVPRRSSLKSRSEAEISSEMVKGFKTNIPLIASPMLTCEVDMCIAMHRVGGFGTIHRYDTIENQSKMIKKLKDKKIVIGAEYIGSNGVEERISRLVDAGSNVLMLDSAHGHSDSCLSTMMFIKKEYPDIKVISGNIVTIDAARDYEEAGADALRIGIGSGSSCETRTVAGCGYNTLDALIEISERTNIPLLADGGIKCAGHIAKAIAAGASGVIIGNLFAATKESCARRVRRKDSDGKYKYYRQYSGMSSPEALLERKRRTSENGFDHFVAPEGRTILIEDREETIEKITEQLGAGLRHALAYLGCRNIEELWKNAKWTAPDKPNPNVITM